jgi:hypothetical protein
LSVVGLTSEFAVLWHLEALGLGGRYEIAKAPLPYPESIAVKPTKYCVKTLPRLIPRIRLGGLGFARAGRRACAVTESRPPEIEEYAAAMVRCELTVEGGLTQV